VIDLVDVIKGLVIGGIGLVGLVEDRPVKGWATKDRGDFGATGISRVGVIDLGTIGFGWVGLVED
jgi:hypothetical protein